MYTLILVEDEALVRQSMAENTDWAAHGFSLAGAYENGQEAIASFRRTVPDVVITDINMPYVDGLELAKHIYTQHPAVLTVMLTGFSEFNYAQQAVKLRVQDYVLKPVSPREFSELLHKLHAELEKRKKAAAEIARLQLQALHAGPMLRNAALQELMQKAFDEAGAQEYAVHKGLSFAGDYHTVLYLQADDPAAAAVALGGAPQDTIAFIIENIALELCEHDPHMQCAPADQGRTLIIASHATREGSFSCSYEVVAKVARNVRNHMGFSISAGIGQTLLGLSSFHQSSASALRALSYRFTMGPEQALVFDELESGDDKTPPDFPAADLIAAIRQCEAENAARLIDTAFSHFRTRKLVRDAAQPVVEQIRHTLIALCREFSLLEDQVLHACRLFDQDLWADAFTQSQALQDAARRIIECNQSYLDDPAKKCAVMATEYIQNNCGDSELSLSSVITHLSVSKSYFSNLFKAHTGMTFVEYLTTARMELAKMLLRTTSLRTYEIAERAGYTDAHYFSVTFKRYVGKTPRQYREARE